MHGPSVLLFNDNMDERELYEQGLALHGFRVSSVDDLDAIGPAVTERSPDAMVLCLRLGDDETWSILETMQCGAAINVPGVLVTGSIRPDAANRLRASLNGCAAFVVKPCPPDALAAVLRAVLAGARGLIVTRGAEFRPPEGETGSTSFPR